MYKNDEPIKDNNEDLLKRSNFAKKLANSIININSKEGFCIGLYGPWGSGKTSVINMMEEEIIKNTKGKPYGPTIIKFDP